MKLTRLVGALSASAPRKIAMKFRQDCCIAATRIAVRVLTANGYQAMAQPTKLVVYNKALWTRIVSRGFNGEFAPDEWSVGIGYGVPVSQPSDRIPYDAHLVAIVKDDTASYIVDLSFGQVSRPNRQMTMPQALAVRLREWPQRFAINECVGQYEKDDNERYLVAPDWMESERTEPIIEQLVKELK